MAIRQRLRALLVRRVAAAKPIGDRPPGHSRVVLSSAVACGLRRASAAVLGLSNCSLVCAVGVRLLRFAGRESFAAASLRRAAGQNFELFSPLRVFAQWLRRAG